MDETPLVFIERWTKSLRDLESTIDTPGFDSATAASTQVKTLGAELTERADELPSYELGRCERELKKVTTKLDEKKSKSSSKPKFSFKRTTTASPAISEPTTPNLPPPVPLVASGSRFDPTPVSKTPSTSLTLSSLTNQYLSYSSLPSTSTSHEALLLSDLTNCFVDLIPPPNDALCSADDALKASFPALYLSGLKNCTVLLPKIQGSVMVHSCTGCELVLGGHQFRMHDSKDCRVYLDTGSTPIIERCQGLVFDGYPDLFNPSLKSNATEAKPPTSFVQDFDHPFATIEKPSPSWRFATGDDRAEWTRPSTTEESELWKSHEGRRKLCEAKSQRER